MPPTLKQLKRSVPSKVIARAATPIAKAWNKGIAEIQFDDGGVSVSSCIRCPSMPCIEYRADDLVVEGFGSFPADLDGRVCPTSAISWPIDHAAPSINLDECISCGLCVVRCPVSAINFDPAKGAVVNDADNAYFAEVDQPSSEDGVAKITALFADLPTRGFMAIETSEAMGHISYRILEAAKTTPKISQHLTRNLLIETGNQAAMRRLGDVNIRMELVFSNKHAIGSVEVELGAGILDAPRNIIDNVAVLHARYKIPLPQISSVIVSLALPNQRTEYWQVIKDIKDVLGVRIGSITLTALIIILWSGNRLAFHEDDFPYTDSDSYSIRNFIQEKIGRLLQLKLGDYGVAETSK